MGSHWVMVTEDGNGHARSSVAAVRALGAAGYRVTVAVAGPFPIASESRYASRRVEVPPIGSPGFAETVRAELACGRYLTVFPSSDAALIALDSPGRDLVDKSRLARAAKAVGLAVPPSRSFRSVDSLLSAARKLEYPVVVKPRVSTRPARRVSSRAELALGAVEDGPVIVQPWLDGGIRAVGGLVWRGRLVAAVHQRYRRIWPPDCGTASAAETVAPDRDVEEKLVRLLQGYEGIFQAQFVGSYLIDLNLRVYGSLPLAVAAGANLPALYCDLLRGAKVRPVRARPGVPYRWLEGDLRNVAAAVRQGSLSPVAALRAVVPRPGTAHSVLSLRDIRPFVARLRYAMRRRP